MQTEVNVPCVFCLIISLPVK